MCCVPLFPASSPFEIASRPQDVLATKTDDFETRGNAVNDVLGGLQDAPTLIGDMELRS